MFQPDEQHCDVCGTDTGDAAGLADRHGPDGLQLFPGFQTQTDDGTVVNVGRQQAGLFLLEFSNLLFLVLSENMAYLVCTLLGMAGIAAQPLWMRYLYRQVIRKKYDILTNLRDTR